MDFQGTCKFSGDEHQTIFELTTSILYHHTEFLFGATLVALGTPDASAMVTGIWVYGNSVTSLGKKKLTTLIEKMASRKKMVFGRTKSELVVSTYLKQYGSNMGNLPQFFGVNKKCFETHHLEAFFS